MVTLEQFVFIHVINNKSLSFLFARGIYNSLYKDASIQTKVSFCLSLKIQILLLESKIANFFVNFVLNQSKNYFSMLSSLLFDSDALYMTYLRAVI